MLESTPRSGRIRLLKAFSESDNAWIRSATSSADTSAFSPVSARRTSRLPVNALSGRLIKTPRFFCRANSSTVKPDDWLGVNTAPLSNKFMGS